MFDELTNKVDGLLKKQDCVVVGISGFGGAGKTTLANKLRDHFRINDSQIVRLDNIFANNHQDKPIFEDYDWPVISELLKNVHTGQRLKYQGRGFYGESIIFDEPLPKVVIIEGVRLFRSDVMQYFDVSVWIDCPPELATKQGEKRDRDNGADEKHVSRWRTEWLPKNQEYFDAYGPQKLATFIYKN